MSYYRDFPQYLGNSFSVTLFIYVSVCKVPSMLEDDAIFDQAAIFTLNLLQ